jgi:hypothetical protein
LGVVSLTTGSTTGVPMSPGYGGCQTATPLPCYTTTYATTGSYTTKAQECYTAIHDASSCYTESRSITRPELHHQRAVLLLPRFPSTTSPRQRITTRIGMLPLTTTPRPTRQKCSSTARAATPVSRSITVRKRSFLKRKRNRARTAVPYLSPTAFLIV